MVGAQLYNENFLHALLSRYSWFFKDQRRAWQFFENAQNLEIEKISKANPSFSDGEANTLIQHELEPELKLELHCNLGVTVDAKVFALLNALFI